MLRSWGWIGGAALLLSSCEGKQRDYDFLTQEARGSAGASGAETASGSGSAGSERAPSDLELAAQASGAVGEICASNAECASGFCVDGVCCQSSCDTVCSRCDLPGSEGICSVTANDPACALSCPPSTDCRSYGSGALTANCEAVGLCRAVADCQAQDAPAGTVCQSGAGTCDGGGECVVAGKKRLGEACTEDAECGQGNCVVGSDGTAICCDAGCDGLCQTCNSAGHCSEAARDDARCTPVDCPDDNLCRDYVPDIDVNLCRGFGQCRTAADCSFSELRSTAQCNCNAGSCSLTNGSACEDATECASGACEATTTGDRACCAERCGPGTMCSTDGARCVQCEGDSSVCADNVSQRCNDGVLRTQPCGNGCDTMSGLCNSQRETGSVCASSDQCQSGLCATDVTGTLRCCDSSCEASGRACGTDGSCVCPPGQQDVGGSCRRSVGQACTQAGECASGACVNRVSGGSVCCAQGCNGSFCSADGSRCVECEGAGATCQGNTSALCDNGDLIPTACGNGCNAATGVCNGLLPNGQPCNAAGQCASNTCALDRNGAQRCCTANCAASGRVCGTDGSCVCPDPNDVFVNGACRNVEGQGCAQDADCRSGACERTQSGAQVCCTGACNGQLCRANGQGCVACEGNASTCQGNSSRSCVNNAFVTTTCANGCNPATGLCNALIPRGGTGCTSNAQCAGSGASCQNQRCCEFNCAAAGKVCDNSGLCQCPGGTVAVGNQCLLEIGANCVTNGDCASNRCEEFFEDNDGDQHGDAARPRRVCSAPGVPPPAPLVSSSDDCCDQNANVFPGQTLLFGVPQTQCPARPGEDPAVRAFDYNCNGAAEGDDRLAGTCTSLATCTTGWTRLPRCGETGGLRICSIVTIGGPTGPSDQCRETGSPAMSPARSCN